MPPDRKLARRPLSGCRDHRQKRPARRRAVVGIMAAVEESAPKNTVCAGRLPRDRSCTDELFPKRRGYRLVFLAATAGHHARYSQYWSRPVPSAGRSIEAAWSGSTLSPGMVERGRRRLLGVVMNNAARPRLLLGGIALAASGGLCPKANKSCRRVSRGPLPAVTLPRAA